MKDLLVVSRPAQLLTTKSITLTLKFNRRKLVVLKHQCNYIFKVRRTFN